MNEHKMTMSLMITLILMCLVKNSTPFDDLTLLYDNDSVQINPNDKFLTLNGESVFNGNVISSTLLNRETENYSILQVKNVAVSTGFTSESKFFKGTLFKLQTFGKHHFPQIQANVDQFLNMDEFTGEETQKLEFVQGRRNLKAVITEELIYRDWEFKIGLVGAYKDKFSIEGNLAEIIANGESTNDNPEIWIAWQGTLQGSSGIFVDQLVWEFEPKIFDEELTIKGFFNFGAFTSYWRCNYSICSVFYVELILGQFYVGQLFNLSSENIQP